MTNANALDEGIAIAAKWVARFGLGFHPDTPAKDYRIGSKRLSMATAKEYNSDMEKLFALDCDPYECGLIAMRMHDPKAFTMTEDEKALILARNIVRLWEGYSDENSEETDSAMRDTFKEVAAMDLHQVDGVLALPLNYFARAFLNDENPEDLTFCEMSDSIKISIGILEGEKK